MTLRLKPVVLGVTPLEDRSLPAGFYPTLYTNERIDLQADYTGSSWTVNYSNVTSFFGSSTLTNSAFYLPASARAVAPSGTNFAFIGAGTGGLAYILPQVQNPALPYLGISTDGSFPGTLTSYRPADTRVTTSQPWIRLDVKAVRGPGNMSIYQTGTTGVPTVWVASGDGISAKDSVYIASGDTEQYSWAFTAPGVYQVDVTATGYRGANQTLPTTSAVQTMSFAVDAPGPVNTAPSGGPASTGGKPIIFTSGGNSLAVAGPTVAPAPVETILTVQNGTLALGTTTDVGIVSGNTTNKVTVTGTISQVNQAINGVVYTPNPGFNGVDNFTMTTSDRGAYRPVTVNEQTDTDTFGILVSGNPAAGQLPPGTVPPVVVPTYPPGSSQALPRWEAIGAATGAAGTVAVVDTETRETVTTFTPYEASFTGGVRVAVADLRKTGTPEIVTAPASGGSARVQAFAAPGSPARLNFFAFDPSFTGGVTLATADINFDGFPDIVVGAGPGGGPAVAVFDGANPANVRRFFAYDAGFRGGVNVAVGNLTGDGAAEIVVGAGAGGGPHVQVFAGPTLAPLASFFATPVTPQTTNGVRVSVSDLKRDLVSEIVTVSPAGLTDPIKLRAFDLSASVFRIQSGDIALTDTFNGGVFVAGVV